MHFQIDWKTSLTKNIGEKFHDYEILLEEYFSVIITCKMTFYINF